MMQALESSTLLDCVWHPVAPCCMWFPIMWSPMHVVSLTSFLGLEVVFSFSDVSRR